MNTIGGPLFNKEMRCAQHSPAVPMAEGAVDSAEISGKAGDALNRIADLKGSDPSKDGISITANIAEHLKNSPLLERLNGIIASALVFSGVKTMYSGVKEHDRVKFLTGSKQTMWGAYYGLNAVETVFKTAVALTPGMRVIGGFINADLGFTALYNDCRKEEKLDRNKVIFDCGATAWGLRHLALGAEGLAHTKWAASALSKASPSAASVLCNTSIMGAVGTAFGIAGGALDMALGAGLMVKAIKTGDREKKILGALDMGIGTAMGASCAMTGLPAALTIGAGSVAMVYRTWRTDKDEIKLYLKMTKETVSEWSRRIRGFLRGSAKQAQEKPGSEAVTGTQPVKEPSGVAQAGSGFSGA